jgi:hypothetical protein
MTSSAAAVKAETDLNPIIAALCEINLNDYDLDTVMNLLKAIADSKGIMAEVSNRMTHESGFPERLRKLLKYTETNLSQLVSSYDKHLSPTSKQTKMHGDFKFLLQLILLLGTSCDRDFLVQWTRCFTSHPYVTSAMSANNIRSRMFMGNQKFLHFGRMPWRSEGRKLDRVLQSLNLLIRENSRNSGIPLCNTKLDDQVEDLMCQMRADQIEQRLAELRKP